MIDKLGTNSDEFVNVLLNATVQQYCTLLQLPNYYDNIMEANFYQSTGECSPIMAEINLSNQNKEESLNQSLKESIPPVRSNAHQDDSDWEHYYENFSHNHNPKKVRIGPQYQVTEVPLLTDIQDFDYLQQQELNSENLCQPMWDPSRISETLLTYYLKNMESIWPYDQFHYQEDLALYYLHLKDYNVEVALMTASLQIDELIKLLIVLKRRKRKDAIFALGQQNKNSRTNGQRALRDRKQAQDDEDFRNKTANYLMID